MFLHRIIPSLTRSCLLCIHNPSNIIGNISQIFSYLSTKIVLERRDFWETNFELFSKIKNGGEIRSLSPPFFYEM